MSGTFSDLSARTQLWALVRGYRSSLAIHAAARLGIADALAGGSQPAAVVAERTRTDPASLSRLLRMLMSIGLLEEQEGRFSLTRVGDLLRADVPGSMRDAILYACDIEVTAWRQLAEGVRTGTTPFELAFATTTFEYLARPEQAELARRFDGFMSGLTTGQARALLAAYDFRRHEVVADIGGGDGSLLSVLLGAHPHLRGVLYDLPHVVAGAGSKLDAAGVRGRCRTVGGSFFDEIPSGADLLILKFILHDWDDERCVRILGNCHRAMTGDARLLVVERVVPEAAADQAAFAEAVSADIHMFVNTGGRERTSGEWTALLARGGFALDRITPTDVPPCVIEARVA